MNILFITTYSQLYGANRSLLSIVEKCRDCGDEVRVLLPRKGDYCEELERKNLKYEVIPYISQLFYFRLSLPYIALPLWNLWTFFWLPFIIYRAKKFHPDLVYSNTTAENIGIMIARALRVKHISHIREFMDLDYRYYFLFGRKAKRRYVCQSDGVVYVSQSVANHVLISDSLPINHRVIYNGIHLDNNQFEKKVVPQDINLGIVGFLNEGKGQDIAIRFFDRIKFEYPTSKLHVWGDKEGAYKKKLLDMIDELELQGRVLMHGFERDPNVIYSGMNVLLMCSRAEGFGRVTVEAMMRGIPVLGYNSGGTAEIIKHGYSGYVFSNEEEFIDSIHKMFSSDDNYNCLCQNAFNDSRDRFSEDRYTNNVKRFIEEICK